MSSTTLPVCPKTGSTSPSLTVHLCLHTAPGNRECAHANRWRDVKKRESAKIPEEYGHATLFGVADRNVECWLATVRDALADELGCRQEEIPVDNPSRFIKQRFGLSTRSVKEDAKARIRDYVARATLSSWIEGSDSFEDFYADARRLAIRIGCPFPNELEN